VEVVIADDLQELAGDLKTLFSTAAQALRIESLRSGPIAGVLLTSPANSSYRLSTYATDVDTPPIPFWHLLFKNIRLDFLGSDDFPPEEKTKAALAINEALVAGWAGFDIAQRFPLEEIAGAHERVETPQRRGRVVVIPDR
jgi:NADPH2:quinone reductase